MAKTYKDGLKDAVGVMEDVYANKCPIDDWDERCDLVREVVDEAFAKIGDLAEKEAQ